MAGRGRGRGRGSGLSFNLESLGIARGDIISNPGRQITLYPPLKFQPLPLEETDDALLDLKVQIRQRFQQSSFFVTKEEKKRDVERYSDKYQNSHHDDDWTPDWSQFPAELKPKLPKKRKAAQGSKATVKKSRVGVGTADDILSKLEKLEKTTGGKEEDAEEEEQEEEEKEGEEQEGEEEEEFNDEEETDYNVNYFDNGEGYGDDDDEDDEPTYS